MDRRKHNNNTGGIKMFIARIKDNSNGHEYCNLYDDNEISIFNAATFSPDIEYQLLPLKISGKTYAERKDAAHQLAIDYQYLTDCGGLSWGEYAAITSYFEKIGRRYGLIQEYRENGII
jgi:hypothetical protein